MEPIFFKQSLNTKAEEFKKYLPVNVNLAYKTLAPYIVLCEDRYLAPILGERLLPTLADYYADKTSDTDNSHTDNTYYDKAIEYIQFAMVRLAYYSGYDVLSVQMSDTGASSKVDSEHRLYRYQEENIKKSLRNEGFNHLDMLVRYIEDNIDQFADFTASEYCSSNIRSLVPNLKTFQSIYNIDNSLLVFHKMRYYIKDVEMIDLPHAIGEATVSALMDAANNSPDWEYLRILLRQFVVYKAVAASITELHYLPTEKGMLFESSDAGGYKEQVVSEQELVMTAGRLTERAERYLAIAINYLNKHTDVFPDYSTFTGGNSSTSEVIRRDNTGKRTFLA